MLSAQEALSASDAATQSADFLAKQVDPSEAIQKEPNGMALVGMMLGLPSKGEAKQLVGVFFFFFFFFWETCRWVMILHGDDRMGDSHGGLQ